jgi:carboxylesterase
LEDYTFDGDVVFLIHHHNPEEFLVSVKYPTPTAADLDRHIIIAHGFTATNE